MDGVVQLGDDGISFGNLLRRIIHGVDGISPKLHAHFANGSILDTVADLKNADGRELIFARPAVAWIGPPNKTYFLAQPGLSRC